MDPMQEEEMLRLIQLGSQNAGLDDQIKQQMAMAAIMREGNAPQMRYAGRMVRAPHWMELLGGLAREKTAGDLDKQVRTSQETQRGNIMAQNEAILRALMAQRQAQQEQPNAAPGILMPGTGTEGLQVPPKFKF